MSIAIQTMSLPPRARGHVFTKRGSKYPLADLQPGTEQCIVLDEIDTKKAHSKLSSAVANFRKANPEFVGKFAIRTFTVQEDGVEKTRVGVWRTE